MSQTQNICPVCKGKGQVQRIFGNEIKIDICSTCGGQGVLGKASGTAKVAQRTEEPMTIDSMSFIFDEIISFPIVGQETTAKESKSATKTSVSQMEQKMADVMSSVAEIKEEQPTSVSAKFQNLVNQLRQYLESTKDLDILLNAIEKSTSLKEIQQITNHLQRWQTFSLQLVMWMQKTEKKWDQMESAVSPLRNEWIQLKRQLLSTLDIKKEQIEARIGERSAYIIDAQIESFIDQIPSGSSKGISELAYAIGGEELAIEKRLLYLLFSKGLEASFDSVTRKIKKF